MGKNLNVAGTSLRVQLVLSRWCSARISVAIGVFTLLDLLRVGIGPTPVASTSSGRQTCNLQW